MKKPAAKLSLTRQTLWSLAAPQLADARGARPTITSAATGVTSFCDGTPLPA